ncbi:MAG: hypothetical protein P9M14_11195 [Candidatus Alcyoniella australis]|nr:hypothetical protein [Candidatus Alcyoniella australis]
MANQVFRISEKDELRQAGPTDLIQLLPAPGSHPLFIMKLQLETLVYAIVHHEFIHLSGPTGTAKSSLLEAMHTVPDNFNTICDELGLPSKKLKIYHIEMATYEAPGELFQRRALKDGSTFDEDSSLVRALGDAEKLKDHQYPLVWVREMGRVHSSSVQGGLLNLMTKGYVRLSNGRYIDGSGVAWVADSNYQAENDSTHTLVTLDDALKRRFSVNLTLDYLSAEQEVEILRHLFANGNGSEGIDDEDEMKIIINVVKLGNIIRRHRAEGELQSLAPPTIYGYLTFLRMAKSLPHLSLQQVAGLTMLGNAAMEDQKVVASVLKEVFGLRQNDPDEDPALGENLF